MKKIYVTLLLLSSISLIQAQNKTTSFVQPMSNGLIESNPSRVATDTLYWTNTAAAPVLIGSANGGYVNGVNGYGDKEKVQGFLLDMGPSFGAPISIEEVLVWFGAKELTNPDTINSKVTFKVYNLNGNGTSTAGAVTNAPGTVVASIAIPINQVDTGSATVDGLNLINFGFPVWVGGDFGVGVDYSTILAGDTIGMVSSTDGDAQSSEMAWEKWNTNAWHTMLQAWPLDIDFAIWPIIDNAPQGVEEIAINGIKLYQNNPNPANGNTTIGYELSQSASNVILKVLDAKGKEVLSFNEGAKSFGKHNITIDSSILSSGNYFYTIQADGKRFAKKMCVTK